MKRLLGILFMIISTSSFATEPPRMMPYNSVVTFGTSGWVLYEDFEIRSAGTRVVPANDKVKIPVTFHLFDVKDHNEGMQRIEWSSGFGDVSPTPFTVDGKTFHLELSVTMLPKSELKHREKVPALASNELVILTAEKYAQLTRHETHQAKPR